MADSKTLVTLGVSAAAVGGIAYVARQKTAAQKYREQFAYSSDQYATPKTDFTMLPQIQRREMIKQNGRPPVGPSPHRADYFYPSMTGPEAGRLISGWNRIANQIRQAENNSSRTLSSGLAFNKAIDAAMSQHASHTGCCGTSYAEQRLKCGFDGTPPGGWADCKGMLSLDTSAKVWDAIDRLAYAIHTYESFKPDSYWTETLNAAGLAFDETGRTLALYLKGLGGAAGEVINDAAAAAGKASASFVWAFVTAGGIGLVSVLAGYFIYKKVT